MEKVELEKVDSKKGANNAFKTSVARLLPVLKAYPLQIALAIVSMVAATACALLLPLGLQGMIDLLTAPQTSLGMGIFSVPMLLFVVGFCGQTIFNYLQTYITSTVADKYVFDLRRQLFEHLLKLPLAFHIRTSAGELNARFTNDVSKVREVIAVNLIDVLRHGLMVVATFVFVLYLNWQLTLVAVVGVLVISVGSSVLLSRLTDVSKKAQDALANLSSLFEETISGILTVKAYTREPFESKRLSDSSDANLRADLRSNRMQLVILPLSNIIGFAALVGILWMGLRQIASNQIQVSVFIAYLAYVGFMVNSLAQLTNCFGNISKGLGAASAIFDLLEQPIDTQYLPHPSDSAANGSLAGQIVFDNVMFRYEGGDKFLLNGLSLTVQPNEKLALVGLSGSGKTTLVNLLLGFYKPQGGGILLDGKPIDNYDINYLRNQIGVVLQDSYIFVGTVRENIRYGRLDATDREVEEAAKSASAHEFIAELPNGYATVVEPRGANFSAGQRQRIAIARLFLKNPKVLILDEATSALDSFNESIVQDSFSRLVEGRTTITIAHRLSAIQKTERVAVLHNGVLAETGSCSELLDRKGLFYDLFRQQTLFGQDENVLTTSLIG
jgi:subfamily B ATP-binding cassette protein MsbA